MAYTDEELRECLTQLADELGETPTITQLNEEPELPSPKTYRAHFGSWTGALEAAGLPINKENPSYTDDELIASLRELADTRGETPTAKQLKQEPELPSVNVYECHFGNWNSALESAGLDINQESYTDEELQESLRQLADELGETPTITQLNEETSMPSVNAYKCHFGSWNNSLKVVGLSINENLYTDDELIDALCEFADTLGETPTRTQVKKSSEMPSATAYEDRFGGWNAALEAAGFDINQESLFTDAELLTVLRDCATELGHTPSVQEMDTRTDFPSANTYVRRFGSWNAALRAAGLTPNTEVERYDGTDEELLELLREFAAELDTSPTMDDVNMAPDLPNAGVFQLRFGGWNAAKRQAGLDTTCQPNWYTDAELIQELRRVARTLEKSPTKVEMNDADAPSPTTYARRFNSWTEAKQEAGLVECPETTTQ